ncbi:MAG: metal-dependent transcriptional regulator [Oscillospiraceae bacterium]|nr:metal-dependent transcriptional regulator [Oscillospiraceae bacterium]
MNKTESREDYLETILLLMRKNGGVRSIDIANELNYSKASISRAVGILKESNYISVDRSGQITFTEEGQKRAEAVYDRHITIKSFLKDIIGISSETAERDACKIEHIISDESFEKIKKMVTENEKKSFK